MLGYRQAPVRDPIQNFAVALEAAGISQAVSEKAQGARGGDFRVELSKASRRGAAGIGELLFSSLALACVPPLEIRLIHDDLPAHLDRPGRSCVAQLERDRANRSQVRRHVFSGITVAPGRALHEAAEIVQEADRQAVEFRLRRVFDLLLAQPLSSPSVEP